MSSSVIVQKAAETTDDLPTFTLDADSVVYIYPLFQYWGTRTSYIYIYLLLQDVLRWQVSLTIPNLLMKLKFGFFQY